MKTALARLLALWVVSACPDAELCAFNDCGSCGNACCKLLIKVTESPSEAMKMLNASMHKGGPDNAYAPSMTYEGTSGFADLTPYGKPVDFIGQAIHTTTGENAFDDSVSFTIAPSGSGSEIEAFSYSLIAGAYCDDGQNYFNIVYLVDSIEWSAGYTIKQTGSCPAPAAKK